MQQNVHKELKEIVNHLKTYLEETREEDFWHSKEILVNKRRSVKANFARQTLKADSKGQTAKVDLERQTAKSDLKADLGKRDLPRQTLKTDLKTDLEKELITLQKRIENCQKCGLHKTRINVVFSRGSVEKGIIFIGEAPGYDEDRQGLPFIGRAGKLLDEVLVSVGLKKEKVYVTNVVKCHPLLDPKTPEKRGNDRQPNREEIAACLPVLREQLALINPKIICTLGAVATNALLGQASPLTKIRGKFYPFRIDSPGKSCGETQLFPTFHPAAILRNPSLKDIFVNDLKKLAE